MKGRILAVKRLSLSQPNWIEVQLELIGDKVWLTDEIGLLQNLPANQRKAYITMQSAEDRGDAVEIGSEYAKGIQHNWENMVDEFPFLARHPFRQVIDHQLQFLCEQLEKLTGVQGG